ncbi:hypothetical protein [Verrucomicrobium spinosum]|uniref:hypothetical protein n=1 Tax=Verrucomicrobium spinosum TaxID=2736 RepID=UPI00094684AB|nr:hypothetical protein [Verrucomicrobium spinosum]
MLALIFSFVIGRAFDFLNLSSLHAAYAARLTRTFLGASNEERVYGSTADDATDVKQAHPKDDVPSTCITRALRGPAAPHQCVPE